MTDQKQNTSEKESKSGPSIALIIGAIVVIVGIFAVGFFVLSKDDTAQPPEIDVPAPPPGAMTATALVVVNVRSGPGVEYPSYGVAQVGDQGEVIGVSADGGWWVVKILPDKVAEGQGWVSAEYVQIENETEVPVVDAPPPPPPVEVPTPDPDAPTATAIDIVNVRSGPGMDYHVYGAAPKGSQGEIIGVSEDGGWWVVEISPDEVAEGQGWVSADWVIAENADNVPVVETPPLP